MDGTSAIAVVKALLLPPASPLLACLLGGLLAWSGRRRSGMSLIAVALLLLAALSMPAVSSRLITALEAAAPALTDARQSQAQAIVILGGDKHPAAAEYGGQDQPSALTLGRLRYGAWLHEQTGLPILVTGGTPSGQGESEAAIMARVLASSFRTRTRWQEAQSNNTAENAIYSARMLKESGVRRVLLVTDAWHMPRALQAFRAQGVEVIAAPTMASAARPWTLINLIPAAGALLQSRQALHEWTGILWYSWRYSA